MIDKRPPKWKQELDKGVALMIAALFPAVIAAIFFYDNADSVEASQALVTRLREAKAARGAERVVSGGAAGVGNHVPDLNENFRRPIYFGVYQEHYEQKSQWVRDRWMVVPFAIATDAGRVMVAPATYDGALGGCTDYRNNDTIVRGFGPDDVVSVLGPQSSRAGSTGFFGNVTIHCGTADQWLASEEHDAADWPRGPFYLGVAAAVVLLAIGAWRLLGGLSLKADDKMFRAALGRK